MPRSKTPAEPPIRYKIAEFNKDDPINGKQLPELYDTRKAAETAMAKLGTKQKYHILETR